MGIHLSDQAQLGAFTGEQGHNHIPYLEGRSVNLESTLASGMERYRYCGDHLYQVGRRHRS